MPQQLWKQKELLTNETLGKHQKRVQNLNVRKARDKGYNDAIAKRESSSKMRKGYRTDIYIWAGQSLWSNEKMNTPLGCVFLLNPKIGI